MTATALDLDKQPRVPDGAYRLGYEWRDGKPVGPAPEWARKAPEGGFVLEHMPPGHSMCAFWRALTNPRTLSRPAAVEVPGKIVCVPLWDSCWAGDADPTGSWGDRGPRNKNPGMFAVEPGHKLYGIRNVESCRVCCEPGFKLCSAHGGQTVLAAGPRGGHEISYDCPKCGAVVAWEYPLVSADELRQRRVRRMRAAGATEEQVQDMLASKDQAYNPAGSSIHDYSDEVASCTGCRYCGWRESAEERRARLEAYAVWVKGD